MTPRKLLPAIVSPALLLAIALLAACGGDGEPSTARPGQLTDPRSVPTASPWVKAPDVIILEPGAITPLSGGGTAAGPGTGEGGAGSAATPTAEKCGKTYTVKSGDYPGLIAEKCGVSLQALLDANPDIEPTNLHLGQELNIPQ